MKLAASVRKAIVIAVALLSSAALANAAHRNGTALDEPTRTPAPAPAARSLATPMVAHAPLYMDDAPRVLRSTSMMSPETTSVHADMSHAAARPALPWTPDHRGDKRERGRATPNGTSQVHRPQSHRGKGQVRNTPATPGMGLLLRYGANAGLEISANVSATPAALAWRHSGRAPPRGHPPTAIAQAALPRVQSLAVSPRGRRPAQVAGAIGTGQSLVHDRFAFNAQPRVIRAALRAPAIVTKRYPRILAEHVVCSRAAARKGMAACPTQPFGGRDA